MVSSILFTSFLFAFVTVSAVASEFSKVSVSKALVTGNPIVSAQKVYNLLVDLENAALAGSGSARTRTIIGQHCEAQKEIYEDHSHAGEYYDKATQLSGGKKPAFVEMDLGPGWYQNSYNDDANAWKETFASVQFLKDRWTNGDGIVGLSFHHSYPGSRSKCFENTLVDNTDHANLDDAWFSRVVDWQSNTGEYQTLLKDLAWAADRMQPLKDANVPVIFRPYHEMNKLSGRFWWANRDPSHYKQLWSIIYNFMTNTRGFKNLIWVWCPYNWDGQYGKDPWEFYPTEGADIVAVDIYSGNPYFPAKFHNDLKRYNKPRAVGENDKLPVRWDKNVDELDARPWVLYSIWGDLLIKDVSGNGSPNHWNTDNNNEAIRDTYAYSKVLTGGQTAPNGNANYNWWYLH